MKRAKLENVKAYFDEQLKDPELREMYEFERIQVSLAREIAELRKQRKLTQNDLAKKLGVKQQYISLLERGRQNPSIRTLYKLSRSLNGNVFISVTGKSQGKRAAMKVA